MAEDPRDRITRALQRHALRCPRCEPCEALAEVVVALAAQLVHEGEANLRALYLSEGEQQ